MPSVIKRIAEYNGNIPPQLHDIKWKALAESPFRFFRGTCHLFAADFMKLYDYKPKIKTWMCGDLHVENFGSYKGENRLVYFDLNDFDEAILASPEPEVARFLTSIVIAIRQMGADDKEIAKALKEIMDTYIKTILAGKALMMESEVAYGVLKAYFERVSMRNRQSFILKHTEKKKNALVLLPDGVHFMPLSREKRTQVFQGLRELFKHNEHFADMQLEDAAFRLAGTGSLGLQRYCVLCYNKNRNKHYLIDIKEARPSCYKGLIKAKQPHFKTEAERVNIVGYTMQFNSPAFSSSVKIDDKWYVVKELQPLADKMAVADFKDDLSSFREVAADMATLMAYAQIRSCGHMGASSVDELIDFAGKKKWQKDITDLSFELADRNNKYYDAFMKSEKIKHRLV